MMFFKNISIPFGMLALALTAQADELRKPNVLFIMSDDHTTQAIGAYGGRLAKLNPTPTIDTLAKEGVLLENVFCHNAICSPSRACIMTGQYSAVNGITDLGGKLPPEQQYLAHEMKKAGYQTAVIGKWHLGEEPFAFDYYKTLFGQGDYFDPIFLEKGSSDVIQRKDKKGKLKTYENAVEMKGHSSDCIGDSALHWFKEIRRPDQPFFLKLHFKAPHDHFNNAPRYDSYLADVQIPEPATLWTRGEGSIATRGTDGELDGYIGSSVSPRGLRNYSKKWGGGKNLSFEERTRNAYQTYLKKYLRCVKGVDDNLKRVLDYLKAEGLYDNTVIFYTGDQGFFLGEHDLIDKRWAYDPSMRMPMLVRYPKTIKPGLRSDAMIENVDFAPTMLEFAGVKTPETMQGRSFKSILETGTEPDDWRDAVYYHYWMHMAHHQNPGHIAVRTKRYKLIYYYGAPENATVADTPPGWELYDLKNDPTESRNLYDHPEYASVAVELKQTLQTRRHETRDDDPKYVCNQVIDEFWEYDEADRLKSENLSHEMLQRAKSAVGKPKKKKK